MKTGLDRLLSDPALRAPLKGRRVAVLGHPASVTADLTHSLDALMACDDLLVPVLPDFLSFHGLKLLFETLGQMEDDLNHRLQRIKIVINQYNPTTRIAREAKRALESHYAEFLSDTIVRQCTDFARASSDGLPINAYAPSSKGARDIDALITEMMSARLERAMERSA